MLKNYFLIAFRNFRHNKIFSLINVIGLSIGISAALVIFLIVQYDFSFDRFEKDRDRIYRIVSDFKFSGEVYHNCGVIDPLADAVRNEVTGIDATVAFHQPNFPMNVTIPSAKTTGLRGFKRQPDIIFADARYFHLIGYQWLAGSPTKALSEPYETVLTEERAKLYFPGMPLEDILGKEIDYNDSVKSTVTGIVKSLDHHTDFTFREFVSQSTIVSTSLKQYYSWDQWGGTNSSSQAFVKLSVGASVQQVHKQLTALIRKYNKDQKFNAQNDASFHLQPLSDIHFNSDYSSYTIPLAHKPVLYGLLLVAIFLLLLGCINFINLATAQASRRSKEIGIRKTMGSSKAQLVRQFLSETFFITLLATLLSIMVTPLLLKVFASFVPVGLHFDLLKQPGIILFLLGLTVLVSLLSGFYPAWVLSRYNPAMVLKNQASSNSGKSRKLWLRQTLTVSQFIIAQIFIMATLVVGKQIHYTLNKDLGFRKDAILHFHTPYDEQHGTATSHKLLLLDKLRALPGIAMVSLSSDVPSSNSTYSSSMGYKDGKQEKQNDVQIKYADTNYTRLYRMKMLAGTALTYSDTSKELIINQTYAQVLGFRQPQQAIGKNVEWDDKMHRIAGVVADFNQRSLHESIKPMVIVAGRMANQANINIALNEENTDRTNWKVTIAAIQKLYKGIYPDETFEYHFLDDSIAQFYKSEQDMASLLKWATGLAILISCLGLLGLVIYTTNQRTKEIGVRRVLGASVSQIVSILSKDFIALVLIAFVIATPVAWWSAYKWLEGFAYKTTISWWIFLLSGLLMVVIALITLSVQTIRAASANPVKSLRTE